MPPSIQRRHIADAAQMQRDADELSLLAQGVPSAISQVRHGQLPKDLSENLKRIEKLAKRIRGNISE